MKRLIDKLKKTHHLEQGEWISLIDSRTPLLAEYLFSQARQVREQHYGKKVFIRGLLEFTNYCKNDCFYCGIRRSNSNASRYRLDEKTILNCCRNGYNLGFRTFVLQGGEDGYFTDERMVDLIRKIKANHPDCALTLSIGEKSYDTYKAFYEAGADRYLLRHETFDPCHYRTLHPVSLSAVNRQQCLWDLRDIGFQVGTGFMVGSPGQTSAHLAQDMLFIEKLRPHMVGIGPFIPHHDTIFAGEPAGSMELTLFMLALIRLMLPKVLLPATTALGTVNEGGREQGILAGANVIMPNLSPEDNRNKYSLYDNKLSTGAESIEGLNLLKKQMADIGYEIVTDRGDSLIEYSRK